MTSERPAAVHIKTAAMADQLATYCLQRRARAEYTLAKGSLMAFALFVTEQGKC